MSEVVNYTCNTCGLAFGAAEYQRDHMRTDWHRYNLKRRVAELPPIPADVFSRKMQQIQQQQTMPTPSRKQVTKKELKQQAKEAKRQERMQEQLATISLGGSRSDSISSADSVGFSAGEPSQEFLSASEATTDASDSEIEDHSRLSRQSTRTLGGAETAHTGDDDVDKLLKEKLKNYVEIPPNVCFMDGHKSETALDNVRYLSVKYGLVIPDEEHVADWEGLVSYFNEKVGLGNCCLSCSYMGRSLAAARSHMLDKQHVKIPWDTVEERAEIIDFYDYPSDDEEEDSEGEEGWEDVDEEVSDNEESDATREVRSTAPRRHREEQQQAYIDGFDLVLGASGRTAGHRSLNRYFKQRAMQITEKPGRRAVKLIDYRSPGVTERAADKMVKDSWSVQKRAEQRYNKGRRQQNFQQHFRDQLLQ